MCGGTPNERKHQLCMRTKGGGASALLRGRQPLLRRAQPQLRTVEEQQQLPFIASLAPQQRGQRPHTALPPQRAEYSLAPLENDSVAYFGVQLEMAGAGRPPQRGGGGVGAGVTARCVWN